MVNKNKVKLMTKLAMYEAKEGHNDLRIAEYDRKDYISFHTIVSLIWGAVGFVLIAALSAIAMLDVIMEKLSRTFLVGVIGMTVGGFLIFLVVLGLVAAIFYAKKYDSAEKRVKRYNRNLARLEKKQDREKKENE